MRPLDKSVLTHLRPASAPLSVVVGTGVLTGLLTVAQAFALGALVVAAVTEPTGTSWHGPAQWLIGIVTLRVVSTFVGQMAASRAASVVSTTLRDRLIHAARTRHDSARGGLALLSTRGVTSVEPYVTRYLPALVPAAVLPVVTVVAIWWLDWISGLIVLLTLPLIPMFAVLIGLNTRDRADRQWKAMGALSGHFLDVVRGLPTLVAHRRARAQVETIRSVTHRYRRATVDTLKLAFASSTALELVATLSVALVAVAVGLRLAYDMVDFRVALTVLLLAPEAYWPLRRVGAEFHSAAEGTAALAEADRRLAEAPDAALSGVQPSSLELSLDELAIGYDHGPSLITPLSQTLPTRGLLAITGPSGCGKSTLLATLRGELPPVAGTVRVGGIPLDEIDSTWWRSQVAWAPQRPWLVADTVAANVRLGRPDATDDEVWAALAQVDLDDVIAGLPHQLDTLLGEDGAGLSAGQRARVALARVVLAGRPVVLLDEPSAHLDEETERILLETIAALARTSLVLTVAHRPAVVRTASDEIALTGTQSQSPGEQGNSHATVTPGVRRNVLASDDGELRRSRWGMRTATLLGALSVASGVALTATAGWLITRASEHPPVLYLMVAIVGVRMFGLGRPVLRHAERVISHDVVLRELAERRSQVYADLVPLVPGRLGPRRGDLLTQVVDDVDAVLDDRLRVRQPVVTSLLVALGAIAMATWLEPRAGAVILAVTVAGPLVFLLARWQGRRHEPVVVSQRAALGTAVQETIDGLRELEQWQATEPALQQVRQRSDAAADAVHRSVRTVALGHALTAWVGGVGVAAMAWAVPAGSVSSAMFALLLLLPLALDDALAPLADAGALSVRTRAAHDRLERLRAMAPAVTEPVDPRQRPEGHEVGLEDVTLAWEDRPVLEHLDLRIRSGEHLGVIGASGTGKSTLAATLMRFIDPSQGAVRLGGTDVRDLRLDDVRTVVGLVDDDPHVFASSVVENVRLARPEASDDQVAEVLTRAGLGDWIAALPSGPATVVGAGARDVSGGERARIALARALLADNPVLVLDEPTAHLDASTARQVTTDLLSSAAGAGRSIVWITHGTVGLDAMDRVVSLGTRPESGLDDDGDDHRTPTVCLVDPAAHDATD